MTVNPYEIGFRYSPIAKLFVTVDGFIFDCNPATTKLLGYSMDEILELGLGQITHPEDLKSDCALSVELLARVRDEYQIQKRYLRKDGSICYVTIAVSCVWSGEEFQYFIVQVVDRNQEQTAIDHLNTVLTSTGDLVLIRDRNGICTGCWETGQAMVEDSCSKILGKSLTETLEEPIATQILDAIGHALETGEPQYLEYEILTHKGEIACLGTKLSKIDDDHVLLVGRDITKRRNLEKRLQYQAVHDPLTGSYNWAYLNGLPSTAAYRGGVYIDLNWFKLINDSRGHTVGDRVLQALVGRLMTIPSCDVIRVGGDEFFILTNREPGVVAAEALVLILEPIPINGHEERVGAAIGYANGLTDGSPGKLREASELAMRKAKENKRSSDPLDWIYEWSPALQQQERRRTEISYNLRLELENRRELWLAYQPIVKVSDKGIVGAEALARWQSPVMGFVSPGEFIPIAEAEGIIEKLSIWVIDSAIEKLQEVENLYISINISPWELENPRFASTLLGKLDQAGIGHERLALEVTEREIYRDIDRYTESLKILQKCRIILSVDDFGTGESGLKNLLEIPYFSRIKLDKQFLPDCDLSIEQIPEVLECFGSRASNRAYCDTMSLSRDDIKRITFSQAVAQLVRNNDMDLISEGVETEWQHEFLKAIDCEYGQGYYYAKPMRWEDLVKIVVDKNPYSC